MDSPEIHPHNVDDATLQQILGDQGEIYEGDVDRDELNHILNDDTNSELIIDISAIKPTVAIDYDEDLEQATPVPFPVLPQPKRKATCPVMLTQPLTKLCEQMQSPAFKREAGIPTVLAIARFIAVGTTHGFVVIFDHNQDLRMILGSAAGTADYGPITAMDTTQLGASTSKVDADWLVCGHQGGQIVLWDVASSKPLKTINDVHTSPVIHLRFITDGRIISADTKGVVNLTQINRVFLMLVAETQLVLNGSVGPILAMSPLLPGNAPHVTDDLNIVAFATSKKVHLIAAISGQGVKIINSKLVKPDNALGLPYLAWRRAINPRTSVGGPAASITTLPSDAKPLEPILAIAWGTELQLLQAVNTTAAVPRGSQMTSFDPRMLDFIPVAQYATDTAVTGLEWLGTQTIVLLNIRDELRVLDPFALSEVETANIKGMELVYHQRLGLEPAFHCALRKSRGRIYLLGLGALHTVHLLTWLERIEWLVGNGQWLDALALALDFYEGRGKAVVGLPSEITLLRDVTASKISELLQQYMSVEIERTAGHVPADFPGNKNFGEKHREELLQLATVCIEYCLAIKSKEQLFGDIFTYFRASRVAWVLVEALEPYIVHDKLPYLNPEVMQEMVEHFSTQGMLSRVERCVLHLDIMSLDFHQVITLCRRHRLFNALAYVYTKGMDDYVTPLDYMMAILMVPGGYPVNNVGKRILRYLKEVLSGHPFPPSAGAISLARLPSIKQEVIDYLLAIPPGQQSCRLHHLLTFDSYETLTVLSAVLSDNSVPSATHQTIADTLISLMIDISQEPFAPHGQQSLSRPEFSVLEQESLLAVIARYYSKGVISVERTILLLIVGYLIFPPTLSVQPLTAHDAEEVEKRKRDEEKEVDKARNRQALLLDVLRVSRPLDYNVDKVMQLAEGSVWLYKVAQYLYSLKRNFSKVLLYHIKDPETRPHTYEFIRSLMMDPALTDEDKAAVKATTISNLAQLIAVDSTNTARLIVEVFNNEHDRILRELSAFPKQQYIYLKAIIENRVVTTEVEARDQLSRASQSSSINKPSRGIRITPEVHELYVRHMCTFSPESIHPYLVSHDDYPLDACLKICQSFGINDATTYLLERTGDVSGALNMMLRSLTSRIETMLNTYVLADGEADAVAPNMTFAIKHADSLPFPSKQQERDVQDALSCAIALCQRNSQRLDDSENEMLWFRLLDVLVVFLRRTKHNGSKSNTAGWLNPNTKAPAPAPATAQPQRPLIYQQTVNLRVPNLASTHKGLLSLTHLVHTTLYNMMGHVAISSILTKIVNDHGSDEFGDFKSIIIGMLDTYAYETTILKTANHLIENDLYTATRTLVRNLHKAYAPTSRFCGLCTRPLHNTITGQHAQQSAQQPPAQQPVSQQARTLQDAVVVFHCSHAFHGPCLGKHAVCPLCTKDDKKSKNKQKRVAGTITNTNVVH